MDWPKELLVACLLISCLGTLHSQTDEDDDMEATTLLAENRKLKEEVATWEMKYKQLARNLTIAASSHCQLTALELENIQPTGNAAATTRPGCPGNLGGPSVCRQLGDMGCYCIVQEPKSLPDAEDHCSGHGMQLVAIETKKEQDLVVAVLSDNRGTTGRYWRVDSTFWTSGFRERGGPLQWAWNNKSGPYDNLDRLLLRYEKPYKRFVRLSELSPFFSVCESSSVEQKIRNLHAYVEAKDCPQTIGEDSSCAYLDRHGCYCAVWTQRTWDDASRHCTRHGMQLVAIESPEEHEQIDAFLAEQQTLWRYWTSGLYHSETKRWVWTWTGQPVAYAKWDASERRFKVGQGHGLIVWPAENLFSTAVNQARTGVNSTGLSFLVAHHLCEARASASINDRRNAASASCSAGPGWTCHSQVTGCYCYQSVKKNWTAASAACQSQGMKLVSIESAVEQLLVASILPGEDDWWTAGSVANGRWTWTTTGTVFNYNNWAKNEPKREGSTGRAVEMFFTISEEGHLEPRWSAVPKASQLNPLCEK